MTAFIASQLDSMEDLRLRIHQQFGAHVWLSEHSKTPSHLEQQGIEEICLAQVRESKKFICIIDGRYGTYSAFPNRKDVGVTLFELEIFQAFLLDKPIFLLYLDQNPNDPRLDTLIRIIQSSDRTVYIDCGKKRHNFDTSAHFIRPGRYIYFS